MASPASAWTFVRRNPARVLPVACVLALATFLLAGLLPLVRSLKSNIDRNVGIFDEGIFVTETNRLAFRVLEEKDFLSVPGVVACHRMAYFPIEMELFIGTMEFAVAGLSPEGMRLAMERKQMVVGEGRLPQPGKPEVALSGDILVSRDLRLGDRLEGLTIVGRLDGPARLGLFPFDAADSPEASFDHKLAFWNATAPGREAEVEAQLERRFGGPLGDVTSPAGVRKQIDDATRNLDVLTAVIVIGAVLVIGLLVGLIQRIYFLQRTREFGILWACGMTRRRLLLRTCVESAILTAGSCALGFGLAMVGLWQFRVLYLDAHGLVVDLFDPGAVTAAVLLLAGALVASVGGAALRLYRFDPVVVIDEGGG
ncbi:MAG: ABC transporter permease [Deltaproteobacteria bacterium]|nr:ABC transporter permease [Deltaproteobacteria bacterium]